MREAHAYGYDLIHKEAGRDGCAGGVPTIHILRDGVATEVPPSRMATPAAFRRYLSQRNSPYRPRTAPTGKKHSEPIPFTQMSLWDVS